MSDMEFTTAVRSAEPIPFKLDGVEFTFNPPKQAIILMPYIDGNEDYLRAATNWLFSGLSEPEAAKIRARLSDPSDNLDIPDITRLVNALDEKVSGRPTT